MGWPTEGLAASVNRIAAKPEAMARWNIEPPLAGQYYSYRSLACEIVHVRDRS
jgi:hypothetical protein